MLQMLSYLSCLNKSNISVVKNSTLEKQDFLNLKQGINFLTEGYKTRFQLWMTSQPIKQFFIKELIFMETSRDQISCSPMKKDFSPTPFYVFFFFIFQELDCFKIRSNLCCFFQELNDSRLLMLKNRLPC